MAQLVDSGSTVTKYRTCHSLYRQLILLSLSADRPSLLDPFLHSSIGSEYLSDGTGQIIWLAILDEL